MFDYNVCDDLIWTQIEAALREHKDEVAFAEAVYASEPKPDPAVWELVLD